MSRQIVVTNEYGRIEPACLDHLPREFAHIKPRHRLPDKYDALWERAEQRRREQKDQLR